MQKPAGFHGLICGMMEPTPTEGRGCRWRNKEQMNMKTFAIKIRRWLEASFEAPVVNATRKARPESKHMNLARLLTTAPISRRHGHRWHHRHRSRHSRCVYLEFVHPRARSVSIAGSFNDWRPTATPMIAMGRGWWVKGLVLPPGRYQYRLVVDGQSMPDPNAAEVVTNPNGGVNSVLVVPAESVAAPPKVSSPLRVGESTLSLIADRALSDSPARLTSDSNLPPQEVKLAAAA